MDSELEPIAIIGMAARVPGAQDIQEFWRNLSEGRESISFPTDEELLARGVTADELSDSRYVKAYAEASGIDLFDAGLFGMTPREAQLCDPQIRMFLESAHAAVENAGYDSNRLQDVGVFASAGANRYLDLHIRPGIGDLRSVTGMSVGSFNNSDSMATMVSYKLSFNGPSLTVQTACSSSLAGVHLAANAIRNGECEMAVVGGAEVEFPVGHGYASSTDGPLSQDGHCRPFDAEATGTVFGSGVGAVVLKRLSQALADGDPVRAVLCSSAMNNDGAGKVGFTAPSVTGQSDVIVEALGMAEVDPADVSYVEAHATGTVLGDPIEVAALKDAFERLGAKADTPWCALGSVKSNVGHLGHAAGVVSLIKAVLCLENELLAPNVDLKAPNPRLELDGSPFYVSGEPQAWPRVTGQPRRAGVSSLGVGGTNVHVVIEEAPAIETAAADGVPRVLPWSARTAEATDVYRLRLREFLAEHGESAFAPTAATLQHGRTAHPVRTALVASSTAEAVTVLDGLDATAAHPPHTNGPRDVAFLLPGQGAQHARMAVDLYQHQPAFAAALDEAFELFTAAGMEIRDAWWTADKDTELADTELAQPLLFAIEYALADMWRSWGITPSVLIGHSVGELTAAAIAEVFTLPEAVTAVAARARAMAGSPEGGMLAVAASADDVAALLPGGLAIAADNGPKQTVVAGPLDLLAAFEAQLKEHHMPARRMASRHAFHTEAMAPAMEEFEKALRSLSARPPAIPIHSAATGRKVTDEEACDPAFWASQLVRPVRFGPALDKLLRGASLALLEVGPAHTLTSLLRTHPAVRGGDHLVLSTLPARRSPSPTDRRTALQAVSALWTEGHDVDWSAVDEGGTRTARIPVPGYPYQRERHWIDRAPEAAAPASTTRPADGTATDASSAPARGAAAESDSVPETPFTRVDWAQLGPRSQAGAEAAAPIDVLALLPADADRARELVALFHQAGLRVLALPEGHGAVGGGPAFSLEPDRAGQLEDVLCSLADEGRYPGLLVHAWTLGEEGAGALEDQLDLGFYSAQEVARLGTQLAPEGRRPGLLVLTSRSANVSGGEPVVPAHATLHALVRTLADEDSEVPSRLIDIGPGTPDDALAPELALWRHCEVLALRGRRRWSAVETPYQAVPGQDPALRPDGLYLVTGGTGGLGLAVAKGLARTGMRPRLALLSRHGVLPAVDLAEIRALGGEAEAVACDVSDADALEATVAELTGRHGQVNGVLHLAGVRGSGMVHFTTPDKASATLAPKVLGALAIERVFTGRPPLDFLVFFSSRAGLEGQVGGADYAAANAYLDALASTGASYAKRVLSINWPAWSTVGMAAGPGIGTPSALPDGAVVWHRTVDARDEPVVDEHRLGRVPVVPGTSHLDFVVTAFREQVLSDGRSAAAVELVDVVFQRMMALDEPRRLEITFIPEADGFHRFTVTSAPPTSSLPEEIQTHARGRICVSDAPPRHVDLDGLRNQLSDVHVPPARPTGTQAFTLGPRWRNIREIRSGGGTEQLLSLGLPKPFVAEAAHHSLHPALMDSATTSARDNDKDEIHVPFLYRSVIIHGALPAEVFSHIRRQPPSGRHMIVADLDVIAADGTVLVESRGFTMRRAPEPDGLVDSTAGRRPEDRPRGAAGSAGAGIPPELGIELLLTVLRSDTREHIAVHRYRDGRFEPAATVAEPLAPTRARPGPGTASKAATEPAAALPLAHDDPATDAEPTTEQASQAPAVPVERPEQPASLEDKLHEMWVEALGFPDFSGDSDFFDLGGNSLSAIQLMSAIRDRFGVDLSIAAVFDHPTLRALTAELSRLGAE